MRSYRKMNSKGSVTRVIRDMRRNLENPYEGIMYDERGCAVDGKWINGLRASDVKALIVLLEESDVSKTTTH